MQTFHPDQINAPSGHFIDGALVSASLDAGIEVCRPSDGKPHAALPLADAETVDRVVTNAWTRWRPSSRACRPRASSTSSSAPAAAVRRRAAGLADVSAGGAYYQPTLLEHVDAGNPAVVEEIFGPVLTVQTFDTEEEGLALAAHEHYGLAAGVHTADIGRALRAMRSISAGTVWINRYGRTSDFVIPTGGYHQSGIGKDLGRQAVEANLRVKSVLIDFAVPQ